VNRLNMEEMSKEILSCLGGLPEKSGRRPGMEIALETSNKDYNKPPLALSRATTETASTSAFAWDKYGNVLFTCTKSIRERPAKDQSHQGIIRDE